MDSGALIENWAAICSKVKEYEGIDASQINAFFSRLEPQAMSEGFLMLTADNDFIKTWIERHYVEVIRRALQDTYGLPFTVIIEVDTTPRAQAPAMQPGMNQQSVQYAAPQNQASPHDVAQQAAFYDNPVQNPYQQHAAAQNATAMQGVPQQAATPQAVTPHQDAQIPGATPQAQSWAGNGGAQPGFNPAAGQGIDGSSFYANAPEVQQDASYQGGGFPGGGEFGMQSTHQAPYPSIGTTNVSAGAVPHDIEEGSRGAAGFEHPYGMSDPSFDHYIDRSAPSQETAGNGTRSSASTGSGDHPTSTLTFENFVIGDSNRMAYSMAVDVAEMPGKTPLNPLFIYGKSGLGKTHLMRAIQNYICETQPHLRTVYVDSAELLSDYMDASAAHDKEKSSYRNFKTHYEEADVLLIDDIQYLQGKKQTLDIVFQIFNKLTSQGKQIVLSADRAPKNIDIDERYHSRFNQGGTIDIQPPEIETKLGIVKSFINEYRNAEGGEHFVIPEDIQMYIAENSSSNIRELKSAVTKVIYQMTFFNQPDLTVSDVRTLLENHFSGGTSKNLTVEDIQKEVESFFKVKHSDLIGPKRARNIVYPRQIAIYLCRQLLDLPFNDIGKKFNRDHSTAMHSVATVEDMMKGSREVQEEIETLKQIIREL